MNLFQRNRRLRWLVAVVIVGVTLGLFVLVDLSIYPMSHDTPISTPMPTLNPTPTFHPVSTLQPTSTAVVTLQPSSTSVLVVNLPPTSIDMITDAPSSMRVNQSYIVKVSLVPRGQSFVSTLKIEKATATVSGTTSVGTPSATLKDAFGLGYEPFASATLSPDAPPFHIIPIQPFEQPLDQQEVVWTWNVIPLEAGMIFWMFLLK